VRSVRRAFSVCSTEILFKELVEATAATGRTTLASIDASIVKQNWP
jgi:hypothetical protein